MNQGRTQSTDTQQGQRPGQDTAITRGQRTDIIHTREMVFSLSPYLLKAYIDLHDYSENEEIMDEVPSEETLENGGSFDPEADNGTKGSEGENDTGGGNDDAVPSDEKSASENATDHDVENEKRDEEEDSEAVRGDETASLHYDTVFGNVSLFNDSAALLTNTVYAITVVPSANGGFRCWFEEPGWFSNRLSSYIVHAYVNKLKAFLNAIANWLETEKQEFLQQPSPQNFVLGEARFIENPVVLQKGFLQRINQLLVADFPYETKEEYEKAWEDELLEKVKKKVFLKKINERLIAGFPYATKKEYEAELKKVCLEECPESTKKEKLLQRISKRLVAGFPYATKEKYDEEWWNKCMEETKKNRLLVWPELDKPQFSRLLDKIWLVWPEWNMPLANIFSSSFHLPWLVEVGTALYSEAGVEYLEPELEYPTFGDKDLADIRSMDFLTLMPEEKLHLLCSHFKKGVETAKAAKSEISVRISRGNNG